MQVIVGQIGRQWVEAVSPNLRDYEAFKKGFLANWWSKSRQSSVRCAVYQDKYDRRSNLSLSAHFLKYATMASYLDPRPSDRDLIEAIKSHFPISVQRAMLTSQLCTVEETLELLKRIEIMEASESFQRPNAPPQSHHQNASRQGPNPPRNDHRGQTQPQVRQVQYQQPRTATGVATIETMTQGGEENPQAEAPAPLTQMLPLSTEGRSQLTATINVRETNGRSHYGPSGPRH